ncbi:MAG: M48 family metalloprotease [Candidatus Wallbacteria bacterium]|nr:M48 family metalloprotease [Candidatus Wallbacteria bacterium]
MSSRYRSRILEGVLLAGVFLAVLGLAPVLARPPFSNSARLPQEFEVHAPLPRNFYGGPPRIPIYKNPNARKWVSSIFSRIASAANLPVMPQLSDDEQRERDRREERNLPEDDGGRKDHRKKGSAITILEWDVVNAFATPGEKLYVTTGLLEFVETDDELAGVIAHEIAHVRLNHIEKRAKRQMISSMLFALATIRGGSDAFMAGQLMSQIPVLPYGQGQELQADSVGMAYVKSAGYDANGTVRFLEKMATIDKDEAKSGGVASIFNTHPPTPQRIELAKKRLAELGVPPGKPTHISYDFKYEKGAIDLSHLQLAATPPDDKLGEAAGHGKVYTKLELKGNLIEDGGFEAQETEGELPGGWEVAKGVAAVAAGDAASGKRCLRLSAGAADGPAEAAGPMAPIDPEQDYLISCYLRSSDPRVRTSLGLRYYDEKKKLLRTDFPAACQVFVPHEWTRYQGLVFSSGNNFSLPPNVRYVRVVATGTFPKGTSSWFDDLTLVKVRK